MLVSPAAVHHVGRPASRRPPRFDGVLHTTDRVSTHYACCTAPCELQRRRLCRPVLRPRHVVSRSAFQGSRCFGPTGASPITRARLTDSLVSAVGARTLLTQM